jgi:hypothetical protein
MNHHKETSSSSSSFSLSSFSVSNQISYVFQNVGYAPIFTQSYNPLVPNKWKWTWRNGTLESKNVFVYKQCLNEFIHTNRFTTIPELEFEFVEVEFHTSCLKGIQSMFDSVSDIVSLHFIDCHIPEFMFSTLVYSLTGKIRDIRFVRT